MSDPKKDKNKDKEYVAPNSMSPEKQRSYIQCWLADNMNSLAGSPSNSSYYTVSGESRKVRNKLISLKGVGGFFEIPGYKLASLVPSFRVFKEGRGGSSEFVFEDQIQGIDAITSSRTGRGSNVGFKSFSYDMKGGSPATAESLVEAKLQIHFSSLADLFAQREGNPSFQDLLAQPGRLKKGAKCVITKEDREKAQNSDYYKITVELGYNVPKKWSETNADLAEQVSQVSRSFSLTLVQHSIDFKEDGSVILELEYQAYVDKLLVDADVFDIANTPAEQASIKSLEKKACQQDQDIKKEQKKPSSNCGPNAAPPETTEEDSDEVEAKKDKLEETRQQSANQKAVIYGALFQKLFESNKVYRVIVRADQFMQGKASPYSYGKLDADEATASKKYMKKLSNNVSDREGATVWTGGLGETGQESNKDERKGDDNTSNSKGTSMVIKTTAMTDMGEINRTSDIPITYFYFGDLLDAAFQCTHTGSQYQDLKFLVGTFPYRKGTSGPAVDIPLGKIPISLQLFQAWFTEHVIEKERLSYPLKSFISDVFTNLIRPALAPQNCFGTTHLIPRLGIETIEAPTAQGGTCQVTRSAASQKAGSVNGSGINIQYKKSGKGAETRSNIMYYYIYATSVKQVKRDGDLGQTQKAQDAEDGIYWLKAGSETGLVKRVKFNKSDQEGLKEARIASEGPSGANMVVDRYNADIEMYGTSLFKPGMTVFIDPITSAIASERSRAVSIGLGGYYKVIEVSTAMEPGVYKTDLKCVWESRTGQLSSGGGGCP